MEQQKPISQALESLPQGITFPSQLSYDSEKKTLILTGPLTEDERNTLLRMSPDPLYSHAIEQLYKDSQLPDAIVWKESTDAHFVTETVAPMAIWLYFVLTLWFILTGGFSVYGLFCAWPVLPSPTQELKAKLDTVLVVQKKQIDSLQAKTLAQSTRPGGIAQSSSVAAKTPKPDTPKVSKTNPETKPDGAKTDSSICFILRFFGPPKPELQYLLLALLAGILGGAARSLSSFVMYRANRRLFMSWALWYFSQPLMGGMYAVIGMALLKAGMIGNSGGDMMSPAGVVAFSALIGLFIDEFTNKLSEVFKAVFTMKNPPASGGKIETKEPEVPLKK